MRRRCCCVCSASFTYAINGTLVSFTDTSPGATTWLWDFGDGSGSTTKNPSHSYAPGAYTVTLTITAGGQTCSKSDTIVIADKIPCSGCVPVLLNSSVAVTIGTPTWNAGPPWDSSCREECLAAAATYIVEDVDPIDGWVCSWYGKFLLGSCNNDARITHQNYVKIWVGVGFGVVYAKVLIFDQYSPDGDNVYGAISQREYNKTLTGADCRGTHTLNGFNPTFQRICVPPPTITVAISG